MKVPEVTINERVIELFKRFRKWSYFYPYFPDYKRPACTEGPSSPVLLVERRLCRFSLIVAAVSDFVLEDEAFNKDEHWFAGAYEAAYDLGLSLLEAPSRTLNPSPLFIRAKPAGPDDPVPLDKDSRLFLRATKRLSVSGSGRSHAFVVFTSEMPQTSIRFAVSFRLHSWSATHVNSSITTDASYGQAVIQNAFRQACCIPEGDFCRELDSKVSAATFLFNQRKLLA